MSRYRNWCFTFNNAPALLEPSSWTDCTYCIYQEEMGDTGTYHLQGYVEFSKALRLNAVKAILPTAHWGQRHGSAKQASYYCEKPVDGCRCEHCSDALAALGGPYIFGEMKGQGSRGDLMAVKERIDEGATVAEIFEDNFDTVIRHLRGFREYKRLVTPPRNWPMEVLVYSGGTGTGKTRKAYDDYPDLYSVPCAKGSGTYWDDYDGQETVLVDEMYGNRFSWGFLLRLCDRYAMKVPVHGSSVEFTSKRIIFTSNLHPGLWYSKMERSYPWDDTNPFKRRLSTHLVFPLDEWDLPREDSILPRPDVMTLLGNPVVMVGTSNAAVAAELYRREESRQCEEDDSDDERAFGFAEPGQET